MPDVPIDALFEHLIDRLEAALEIAASADRTARLTTLAQHGAALHHLTATALIVGCPEEPKTQQNPLD